MVCLFVILCISYFILILHNRGVFKRTAANIVSKLSVALNQDVTAVYNVSTPRRGAFVLKVANVDAPIVELLSLKRPFTDLRNLDVDNVVKKIQNSIL